MDCQFSIYDVSGFLLLGVTAILHSRQVEHLGTLVNFGPESLSELILDLTQSVQSNAWQSIMIGVLEVPWYQMPWNSKSILW